VAREVIADEDAAEGMGDEVDTGGAVLFALCDDGGDSVFAELLHPGGAGGILGIDDLEAGLRQGLAHGNHGAAGPAEAVK